MTETRYCHEYTSGMWSIQLELTLNSGIGIDFRKLVGIRIDFCLEFIFLELELILLEILT